jgi:hypothetical protein
MRTQPLHFEQVPVVLVKKIAKSQAIHSDPIYCPMCGETVELERCMVDERGAAVHSECYVANVLLADGIKRMSAS